MLKIVLDTNVLIDAADDSFHFANRIVDLVIAGKIEAYANRGTARENKLLANRKITDAEHLQKLNHFFDLVKPVEDIRIAAVADDPEDNKILASALAAQADFLVTSDQHLLQLGQAAQTQIVRPNEFWSRWEEEGDGWRNWLQNFVK